MQDDLLQCSSQLQRRNFVNKLFGLLKQFSYLLLLELLGNLLVLHPRFLVEIFELKLRRLSRITCGFGGYRVERNDFGKAKALFPRIATGNIDKVHRVHKVLVYGKSVWGQACFLAAVFHHGSLLVGAIVSDGGEWGHPAHLILVLFEQ